jgi:GNAT superfamily N-acetyltransferase
VPASFQLRDAQPDDAADIARLVMALAAFEELAHEVVATEHDFRVQLFGPTPRAHAMIADIGGAAVGLALWFYNFSTFVGKPGLYVEDVFVEPAYRGLGIGRALFRAMARRALEHGCGRMDWSVLNWNEKAIAFYRGMNAQPMSGWTVQRLCGASLDALAREE